MKKYIFLAALFIPNFAFASFDTSLSYGTASQSVLELQDFLHEENCFALQPTGFFGSITLNAVKCFQKKYGIIETGYFGVLSRAQANEILAQELVPSQSEQALEASTSPVVMPETATTAPPTYILQTSPQIIYLPSQDNTQKIMPKLTGEIPIITFSDNQYDTVWVNLSSSDFTPTELGAIVTTVKEVDNSMGKNRPMQVSANITLSNLPKKAGRVEVTVTADGHSAADISPAFFDIIPDNTVPDGFRYAWRNE